MAYKVFIALDNDFYNNHFYTNIAKNEYLNVTSNIEEAEIAIAVPCQDADKILTENKKRGLEYIYRPGRLPIYENSTSYHDTTKRIHELFRNASATVWQSKQGIKIWDKSGLIPVDVDPTTTIIPDGVDVQLLHTQKRERRYDGKRTLLCINPTSAHTSHIKVLEDIILSTPDVQFLLLGQYPSTLNINKYNNVTYLGDMPSSMTELAAICYTAHALIFTDSMECNPSVVAVAVACGLPVIYYSPAELVTEICDDMCIKFTNSSEFVNNYRRAFTITPVLKYEHTVQYCTSRYIRLISAIIQSRHGKGE